jgi:hypothetical protein
MGADLTQIGILARREIEARILAPVVKEFIKEIGRERTLQIVEPIILSLAREAGTQLSRMVEGTSLEHFMKSFPMWTREDALQVQILEQTPKRVSFNVTRCRYAEMYRELGIADLAFLLSCNRDGALIEGFNPKIKFTRTQTIMQGAPFCDFRYEMKG